MSKIKVAVLRGGPSGAYNDSLKTGGYVLNLLRTMPEKYEPLDIFISRDNEWHHAGLANEPQWLLKGVDVAWNALHGEYGEDGEIQRLLDDLRIPYTGSGAASSAFAYNKDIAKGLYLKNSLATPVYETLCAGGTSDDHLVKIFRSHMFPLIVKPATGARAAGIHLVRSFHEFQAAVKSIFSFSPRAMVEEYLPGTVVSCVVIEKARDQDLSAFLPAHLETERRRARPTPEQNRKMEDMARVAHRALGLRHYSSSDFIVTPKGGIYIIETNSHPVIHEDSLAHLSFEATGWSPKDFASHLLHLALHQKP